MAFVKRCLLDLVGLGRKVAELDVETRIRELEDVPLVEALLRYGDAGEVGLIEVGGIVE